jgi:hypothetical protein
MYVRPGNSWDLRSCRQQPGESLREYIRQFSKQRTELPNITDSDVIGAFLAGTTCRDLVSKLGRKTPTKASELMDIATKFASSQEAVEAIFQKDKQPQGRQQEDVHEASAQRGAKKKVKNKSQAKRDAADTDLVAAAEHRNPRKPPRGANLFDMMLKESCPYHQGPVKHTLEECVMLQRYFHKVGPPAEGGKGQDNDKKEGDKAEEFPEVHGCFMIYCGRVVNASARHRKQERREVCSEKVAAPVYLDWSDKPITFDQGDHPRLRAETRKVTARRRPRRRQHQAHQGPHGRGQQPQHHLCRDPRALGDRSVYDPGRCGALSRDHPREARPAPWTTRSACLLRNSLQLPKGNPHVRGGRVLRNLPRGAGETVLRQVHGRPQLHLPQAQDVEPQRGHHRRIHVLTRVRM